VGKPLEEVRRAALGDLCGAFDYEVLAQAPLVDPIGLHGECDPWIAAQVEQLSLIGQRGVDDLAVLDADPRRAEVR
jgi:hypothetical protein